MEIDALFLLTQILKEFKYTNLELLIMKSYIGNKNININLSLRENAKLILQEDESLKDNCIIDQVLNSNERYLDVPIYRLLLQNRELRNILTDSKGLMKILDQDTMLDVVETILVGIEAIGTDTNHGDVIGYLNDFLQKTRLKKNDDIKRSVVINGFVKSHEEVVSKERERKSNNYQEEFFYRMLIYRLFSCGYVTFDYNQVLDPESKENGVIAIIKPLLEIRSYGHLRMMINGQTLTSENVMVLKELIREVFGEFYRYEVSDEDVKKDMNFIDNINIAFKTMDEEAIEYDELTKVSCGMSF